MGWDSSWQVNGQALTDVCANVWMPAEPTPALRGTVVEVPFFDGAHAPDTVWSGPVRTVLMTVIRGTDTAGNVTHVQGQLGHLLENRATLSALLRPNRSGPVTVRRTVPDWGTVEATAIFQDAATVRGEPWTMAWPMTLLTPWQAATATTDSRTGLGVGPTSFGLTVGGNMPALPTFTIDCTADGSNPAIELTAAAFGTGAKLTVGGSYTAGQQIVIDVAARSVTVDATPSKNVLTVTRAWWLELSAGSVTLQWTADAGTWNLTTSWKDRWR